jgi:predicted ester cyclase
MRNGALVRRFVIEVLARGDMVAFDALVADEIVVTSGIAPTGPMRGKAAFGQGLGALAAFSEGSLAIENIIPAGDRVTVRYTAFARHTGPQLGVEPTNRRIRMSEIRLMRFADRRIVEDYVADVNNDRPWLVYPRYCEAWLAGELETGAPVPVV